VTWKSDAASIVAAACVLAAGGASAALSTAVRQPLAAPPSASSANADGLPLERQLDGLLTSVLGPGKAAVSVEVVLDHNRTHAAKLRYGSTGTAQQVQTSSSSLSGSGATYRLRAGSTTWARGEQLTTIDTAPGRVRQIHLGLIFSSTVSPRTVRQLKRSVTMLAGIRRGRGDTVAVTRTRFTAPAPRATGLLSRALLSTGRWVLIGVGSLAFLFAMSGFVKGRAVARSAAAAPAA
jgi:flagellar biosynthesis/type III secretory pathway M-ring protein FliF/YscJ